MNKEYGYRELEDKMGYSFRDESLLITALTHSSYKNEKNNIEDYERLEFLGDAVLELTVSEFLYRLEPKMKEGEMTKLRASLVCEPTLAFCAMALDLGDYIFLGKGEDKSGGRERESICSDVFEAVIGGIFLDRGIEPAKAFIHKYVLTDYENKIEFRDSKTLLQEHVQNDGGVIEYRLINESGPDHARVFESAAYINGECLGKGIGRNKKHSEQLAAYEALKALVHPV